MRYFPGPALWLLRDRVLPALFFIGCCSLVDAADFVLTIAGGYNPSGNQASLEANVIFLQEVLREQHHGVLTHEIYFADGHDAAADLQIVASKRPSLDQPVTDLLASLHRRRGLERVEYRNHRVPEIAGSLNPELVRRSIESIAAKVKTGDRFFIYVTAHGSPGPDDQEYNTTIDCWNEKKISAIEFERWLGTVPADVPVIMVMAQCYCGGFARTIFQQVDKDNGLSPQVRVGFFAQQHNLPAAGCRPDIEHDEEFSSYFWGALAGRSRNGVAIEGGDVDGDGTVSFAEAYAHTVAVAETIDIPLKTTDVFLRVYSRMPDENYEASMSGSLQKFVDVAGPIPARIVISLSKTLGFSLEEDVQTVMTAYDHHRESSPIPVRRMPRGRRGGGTARRELLQQIGERWPELADERHWEESPLLKAENQNPLFTEFKELPGWKTYDERRVQLEATGDLAARHELKDVKFRRLIKTLELILLEKNLPTVAGPEIVVRFNQMKSLEESGFTRPAKGSKSTD